MLLVNDLQQDQNHEAEALPSYASMDEFPEKIQHSEKDTIIFQFLEKIVRSKDIKMHFFATWKRHDREK